MMKINISSFVLKNILLYTAWIVFHYVSAHLYTHVCVPKSLIGFLVSPFVVSSPHCLAIRWVVTKSGDNICMMWMILGNAILLQINHVTNFIQTNNEETNNGKTIE